MIQILVNNKPIQLLQKIPELISLRIQNTNFPPTHVHKGQGKGVMEWIYDLARRAKSIEYNGTILTIDQLNKPK